VRRSRDERSCGFAAPVAFRADDVTLTIITTTPRRHTRAESVGGETNTAVVVVVVVIVNRDHDGAVRRKVKGGAEITFQNDDSISKKRNGVRGSGGKRP